tara:strand:- start:3866 stop:5113 length:1248 start_codon:yes stop_codon:yes gene_type:complete
MKVIDYLSSHTIDQLKEEFSIIVTDYPDRVVLNYNQIDSPRFHPIVDECRALILRKPGGFLLGMPVKGNWYVMARSFNRFYNIGEGHAKGVDQVRLAEEEETIVPFNFANGRIYDKLDGSLMSVYHDGDDWHVSTRKMAFAEGKSSWGRSFSEIFWEVANKKYDLKNKLNGHWGKYKNSTLVFELTGPENRVVTPYTEADITLLTVRDNKSDKEHSPMDVDAMAMGLKVPRPKQYTAKSAEDLVELVSKFPTMEEGVVIILDGNIISSDCESINRIKCKNPQFVAIAHMRENGNISPKNVLRLIMVNEHHEYLKYFADDKPYFDFVESQYKEAVERIKKVYNNNKGIVEQKEFALSIMPETVYTFEKGIIFSLRKNEVEVEDLLAKVGPKKIADGMDLKEKFLKEFGLESEDEAL